MVAKEGQRGKREGKAGRRLHVGLGPRHPQTSAQAPDGLGGPTKSWT